MDYRSEWKWQHWVIRYACLAFALLAFISAVRLVLASDFRYAPLLVGASLVVHGLSWLPAILLSPGGLGPAPIRSIQAPGIAVFELAHGVYWLAIGSLFAAAFPLFVSL